MNDCRQTPSRVSGESGHGAIVTPRGHMATATPNPPAGRGLVNARPTALRSAVLLVLALSSAWPIVAGTPAPNLLLSLGPLVPAGAGCAYQATEQQRWLADLVAKLAPLPAELAGREGQ